MLTVVLKGDKRRPSGQGPGAKLRNGLASQNQSASRAARAHRGSPARPAPPDRATQRQRPAPGNNPQPRTEILRAARPLRRLSLGGHFTISADLDVPSSKVVWGVFE